MELGPAREEPLRAACSEWTVSAPLDAAANALSVAVGKSSAPTPPAAVALLSGVRTAARRACAAHAVGRGARFRDVLRPHPAWAARTAS